MENLYQLYNQLGPSKKTLLSITSDIEAFYYKKIRAKMKFGMPQPGENNSIRLRHLIPPVYCLKRIQNKICIVLQKIDVPDCMYGAVEGSNNVINALQHIENRFFLTIDLKDFFSRINNSQVHKVFMENGYCYEAARILTKLTTYKGGLPQGAPSSPILANLAFKNTVLQILSLVKDKNITFTTYLDDLTFSSKEDFRHLQNPILEVIRNNKFFPHYKKIHYRENICDVTGLFVGHGKLKIHPAMRKAAQTNRFVKKYILYVEECYEEYRLNKNSFTNSFN